MNKIISKLSVITTLALSLSLSLSAQSFFTVLDKTLSDYGHVDLTYVNNLLASESRSSQYKIVRIKDPILEKIFISND